MLRAYKTAPPGAAIPRGMSKLVIACALVAACGKSPVAAPATPASVPALPFAGLDRAIAPAEAPNTTSVLVMQRGAVVHETYVGGATADTLHDTRSVGKSLTALAIGIAIDRGVLPGVEAKVVPYFADLAPAKPSPIKAAITVEDLLTMSSALDCDDNDEKSPGNEENMYPLPNWARWAVDLPARTDYARDASGRGPWHYCTAGTFLLGQVIERAAKEPVDEFMIEHLLKPLGIAEWRFTKSPAGETMTGGGLRLRTRDFAAIGELLRNRGAFGGKQIVSRAFVDRALTVQRTAFPEDKVDYGYLLWHRMHPSTCGEHAAWYMSGNGGNLVAVIASLDAVVVITRTNYNQGRAMHEQTKRLLEDHILPQLCATRRWPRPGPAPATDEPARHDLGPFMVNWLVPGEPSSRLAYMGTCLALSNGCPIT